MKEFFGTFKSRSMAFAAIYAVVGLAFLLFPEMSMDIILYIIAGGLLVTGTWYAIGYFTRAYWKRYPRYDLVVGLAAVALAALMLINRVAIYALLPAILGLVVIADGAIKLQDALSMRRVGYERWAYMLIPAILCVGCGSVLLYNPFAAFVAFVRFIGGCMVFGGVTDIFNIIMVSRKAELFASFIDEPAAQNDNNNQEV